MRNSAFVLLAGVLAIGVGAAHANDEHNRRRQHEFRLECKYIGEGVIAGKKGGAIIPHHCTAEVRFCRRDRDHEDLNIANLVANNDDDRDFERCRDEDRDRDRTRMEIECDGRFLFRDRAFRESFGGYEFIFGVPNQLPVIKVPLDQFNFDDDDHRERHRDHAHVVNSWLKIGDDVLDGFCAVKERRDGRDRREGDLGPAGPTGPSSSTPAPVPAPAHPVVSNL